MIRLWDVAKKTKGIVSHAKLTKLLGVSFQNIAQWEKRGISKQGAILAANKLNCPVDWIINGNRQFNLSDNGLTHDDLTQQMIELMTQADERGKQKMLIAAEDALHAHFAWLDSLPTPVQNHDDELNEYVKEKADSARRKLFQDHKISEQKQKYVRNCFDDHR